MRISYFKRFVLGRRSCEAEKTFQESGSVVAWELSCPSGKGHLTASIGRVASAFSLGFPAAQDNPRAYGAAPFNKGEFPGICRRFSKQRVASVILGAALATAPALAANSPDREDFTRDFQKSLTLPPGQAVRLDHQHGNVTVRTHGARELKLQASIRVSASDKQEAEQFGNQIQILVDQTAAGVSVRTQYPQESNRLFSNRPNISFSVNYDLLMPADSPLTIKNSFGSVTVTGLKASGDFTNAHGLLSFSTGQGVQRLENSFGGIEVNDNTGDVAVTSSNSFVTVKQVKGAVTLKNRFGKVSVSEVSQGVTIANSNGAVELSGTGGPTSVMNSFGPVVANRVFGDLAVNASNGSVAVRGVAGAATLISSFSSITFYDIGKKLSCTGSNGRISGSKVGETAVIRNSFGAVELKDVGGAVEVENANGKILVQEIRGNAVLRNRFGEIEAAGISGNATLTSHQAEPGDGNCGRAGLVRSRHGQRSGQGRQDHFRKWRSDRFRC